MGAPRDGARSPRLASLDLLRGLVIVLMALDHVRGFWSNAPFDPTGIGRTTPALFATRWVTHLCAPRFVLLVGAGAYLPGGRASPAGRPRRAERPSGRCRGSWPRAACG